jgi:hypothetical protein
MVRKIMPYNRSALGNASVDGMKPDVGACHCFAVAV